MESLNLFASHAPGEPHLFGWYLGAFITTVVIVAVVVLVAKILQLAERIGRQARVINQPLVEARSHTEPLPKLRQTINHAEVIVNGLRRARTALGGG